MLESLVSHEYLLVFYGVALWQLEQFLAARIKEGSAYLFNPRHILRCTMRSMLWGGLLIIFDDEALAWYNSVFNIDYETPPWFFYIVGGFFIDMLRNKFAPEDGVVSVPKMTIVRDEESVSESDVNSGAPLQP